MGNAKRDHILIWGGSLLIGAALCLLVWNMMNEHRAARSAQQALKGLTATEVQAKLPEPVQPPADMKAEPLDPAREMPTTTVNGVGYAGDPIPGVGISHYQPVERQSFETRPLPVSRLRLSG